MIKGGAASALARRKQGGKACGSCCVCLGSFRHFIGSLLSERKVLARENLLNMISKLRGKEASRRRWGPPLSGRTARAAASTKKNGGRPGGGREKKMWAGAAVILKIPGEKVGFFFKGARGARSSGTRACAALLRARGFSPFFLCVHNVGGKQGGAVAGVGCICVCVEEGVLGAEDQKKMRQARG